MHILPFITPGMSFENVKTKMQELGLVVIEYPEDDLYLVKYVKTHSDMKNTDVYKCRGVIFRMSDNQLICLPPMKSSFIPSDDLSKLDFKSLSFEEFLDGTMINVFYHNGTWRISSRSYLDANCKFYSNRTFRELFLESCNLDLNCLNQNSCYTFVLQHPENRIVRKYEVPSISLVCARMINGIVINNLNIYQIQAEMDKLGIQINTPERYNFDSIEDIYKFMSNLHFEKQGIVIKTEFEDFPVRFKIRNMHYNYVKNLRGNTKNLKYLYYNMRKSNSVKEYLQYFPEYSDMFGEFQNEIHNTTKELFKQYHNCYVKKISPKNTIPYEYKPLCYELHGIYLKFREYIDFNEVKKFINDLPSERLLFVVNFKFRTIEEVTNQIYNMDI